jgi:CheY-like chemotaxis protein
LTADVTTVDLEKCKAVGMNDYISKPVDERLLYGKIVELFKKHSPLQENHAEKPGVTTQGQPSGRSKCVDLTYLFKRTKTHPELMIEMIELYLEQTPILTGRLKQGLAEKNWNSVYGAIHKMIPSFSIMGMNKDIEAMSLKIQEYASSGNHPEEIELLIGKVDIACAQACIELKEELKLIERKRI